MQGQRYFFRFLDAISVVKRRKNRNAILWNQTAWRLFLVATSSCDTTRECFFFFTKQRIKLQMSRERKRWWNFLCVSHATVGRRKNERTRKLVATRCTGTNWKQLFKSLSSRLMIHGHKRYVFHIFAMCVEAKVNEFDYLWGIAYMNTNKAMNCGRAKRVCDWYGKTQPNLCKLHFRFINLRRNSVLET